MRFKTFLFLPLCLFVVASCSAAPSTVTPNPTPTLISISIDPPTCTSFQTIPTPGPDAASIFPPITDSDRTRGPADAAVTILFYGDYQDGRSGIFVESLNQVQSEFPNGVRVVSRIYPFVEVNDKAALAAQAVEAAAEQDRFWEIHDLLYTQQETWTQLSAGDFEQWVSAQAAGSGMDAAQFQSDMKREDIVAKVQGAWKEGQKAGLPGVPLIAINGELYAGPRNTQSLREIVGLIVLGKRQFTSCPTALIDTSKNYIATLHTEKGDVVIELYADKAPITVNSFVFLAQNGWYDDITFHRVVPDLFVQTGDPSGTGKGTPGYYVNTEILPDLKFDKPGVVGMANSGPDSSNGQFFITLAPAEQFNGRYSIFGQVLSGMDVLQSLTPRDPLPGVEAPLGDKLLSVTIEEK